MRYITNHKTLYKEEKRDGLHSSSDVGYVQWFRKNNSRRVSVENRSSDLLFKRQVHKPPDLHVVCVLIQERVGVENRFGFYWSYYTEPKPKSSVFQKLKPSVFVMVSVLSDFIGFQFPCLVCSLLLFVFSFYTFLHVWY